MCGGGGRRVGLLQLEKKEAKDCKELKQDKIFDHCVDDSSVELYFFFYFVRPYLWPLF